MPPRLPARTLALLAALPAMVVAGASPASARRDPGEDGDRAEVRVAGTCGNGANSMLRLRSRDGAIESEFEVHHTRAGSAWYVTIVHERHLVYRGHRRASGPSRSLSVSYRVADYSGVDRVVGRGIGPRGLVCTAAATLAG